jgi:hypothetical protein
VSGAFTATFAEPEPAVVVGVFEPYDVDVPYSNHQVVAVPPGLTVPVSVAVVPPTELTGPVSAVGAAAAAPSAKIAARRAEAARTTAAVRRRRTCGTLCRRGKWRVGGM